MRAPFRWPSPQRTKPGKLLSWVISRSGRGHYRLWQLWSKPKRPLFRGRGVHALCRAGLAEPRNRASSVAHSVSEARLDRAPFRDCLGLARQSISFLLRAAWRAAGQPKGSRRRGHIDRGYRLWLAGPSWLSHRRVERRPRTRGLTFANHFGPFASGSGPGNALICAISGNTLSLTSVAVSGPTWRYRIWPVLSTT